MKPARPKARTLEASTEARAQPPAGVQAVALPRVVAALTGAYESLLLARLLARLLAARPDNPAIQALYALTDPLVGLLHPLDAQQPRFGAVLELSTLTLILLVPVFGYIVWRLSGRYGRST